jgi:insertion element IS1 protein InsB
MNNLRCPQCGLSHIKRNGYTHYGKQNYRCKDCDRQFVEDSQHIGEEVKDLIKVLLLERLSLRGICRVTRVSLTWLLDFIAEVYAESPDDLNVKVCQARGVVQLLRLEAEADEMWSFVASKRNKQWIWIALDVATKQVIAFYVGDRSASSARELWRRIPQVYRVLAVRRRAWGPLVAYPPLMSYIFFTEALNEIGDISFETIRTAQHRPLVFRRADQRLARQIDFHIRPL